MARDYRFQLLLNFTSKPHMGCDTSLNASCANLQLINYFINLHVYRLFCDILTPPCDNENILNRLLPSSLLLLTCYTIRGSFYFVNLLV